MDVLHPLSAGLIRGIHIDGRHQFTASIRGEFFNMNVLVRFLDELADLTAFRLNAEKVLGKLYGNAEAYRL